MKSLLMLILVMIVPAGGAARAQVCPDRKASQVPARVQNYGPNRRCEVGVSLFGHTFGLIGGRCPKHRLITPAHQECKGAPNPRTYCEYEHVLSVVRQTCNCSFQTVVGVHGAEIVGGECVCQDDGNAGTVEDAQTTTCIP